MQPNELRDVKFRIMGKKVDPKIFLSMVSIKGSRIHFGQSGEDAIILRLVGFKKHGTYVDVGAFHPHIYSNTFLLYSLLGWNGINIDASFDAIELFKKERPNDVNVHAAISDLEGSTVYWKFSDPARNTISKENLKRQLIRGDTTLIGEETIQVCRLESVLDKHLQNNTQIDLMNIDVEGSELQVLKSNNWEKYVPSIILVEDYTIRTGGINQSAINQLLTDKGYQFFSHCFDTSIYIHENYKIFEYENFEDKRFDFSNFKADKSNEIIEMFRYKDRLSQEIKECEQLRNYIMDNLTVRIKETQSLLELRKQQLLNLKSNNKKMLSSLEKKKAELDRLKEKINITLKSRNKVKNEYLKLKKSRSWRITKPLRIARKILVKGMKV